MSKKYNIKWNESDAKELARSVKNFNAKVTRLKNKYGNASGIVIPEKVSVKELKELVGTRSDLKRELNSLKRFTERGAEELVRVPTTTNDVKMTKWQKKEMNMRVAVINRRRKQRLDQIKDLPMKSGGEELGYTVNEFGMGKADELSLKPMNAFTAKMDKYDVQKKFKAIRKHSQSNYFDESDKRLVDNYVKSLEDTYGAENVKDIVDKILDMDFGTFYKTFKSEPEMFEFSSKLPPDADLKANLEHIRATWMPNKKP